MIRLTIPSLDEDDFAAVRAVLETGYLVQGVQVRAFEQAVAEYVGCAEAVAVSNCTAALHLALLALGVGPGDLVLVTTYSWPATANVIELCGAQPVFVEIESDTFNMSPERLETVLRPLMTNPTTVRRVKAILPVHTFGQMADMDAIATIAARYDLPVIEDAACALGASWQEKAAGTWGILGCFSFHPRKAVTTGEGGIITTQDGELAWQLRALRNHGQDPAAAMIDFVMPGFNYRLTEFQGALGVTQMAKLDRIIAARREKAAVYDRLLAAGPIQAPFMPADSQPVYQSYVVLLPEEVMDRRAAASQQLRQLGIETTIGTWHMPLTTYFRTRYGFQPGDFPVTDAIFARTLTLPLHEFLTTEEQEQVVTQLTGVLFGG
jgi:perosamine synthetase